MKVGERWKIKPVHRYEDEISHLVKITSLNGDVVDFQDDSGEGYEYCWERKDFLSTYDRVYT